MELPHLGQHCHETTCNQLDFLPMKCDSCSNIFCKDHIRYEQHSCAAGFRKDVQVPVCPLCNKPVPGKRGEAPDIAVSDHIDRECQSDPAVKKRKVYANRCTKKGCKQKELVPVICSSCHQNFCLKHRHTADHDCKGFQGSGRSVPKAGAAAINRQGSNSKPSATSSSSSSSSSATRHQSRPQQTSMAALGRDLDRERRERAMRSRQQPAGNSYTMQAGMSEDEAMARAIQMSLSDGSSAAPKPTQPPNPHTLQQEDEDLALARALAASEEEERNRRRRQQRQQSQSSSGDSKCSLS